MENGKFDEITVVECCSKPRVGRRSTQDASLPGISSGSNTDKNKWTVYNAIREERSLLIFALSKRLKSKG